MSDQAESVVVPSPDKAREARAIAIGVAGWVVPGLGHALQKMWGRALTFFVVVGVLVIVGAGMRGNLFGSEGGDAFAALGYFADLGTGSFYWLAKYIQVGGTEVLHVYCAYRTRLFA